MQQLTQDTERKQTIQSAQHSKLKIYKRDRSTQKQRKNINKIKTGLNPDVRERYTVPVSYKTHTVLRK